MGQDGYRKLVSVLLDKVATVADKTAWDRQLQGTSGLTSSNTRRGWTDEAGARRSDSYVHCN
jgi:hypothetical protein